MGFRLSNAIGAPFRDFVREQLKIRAEKSSTLSRSPEEVLFLANKGAWVRLMSSVNVEEVNSFLAERWTLQGGTKARGEDLRSGLGEDSAYGLGGTRDQGFRPMPGLQSVSIETAGRLGSLRFATINFKVWTMEQLDVIDTLYFRLGFSMLLEWGHVAYFDNKKQYVQNSFMGLEDLFFKQNPTKEELQYEINRNVKLSGGNYDAMLGTVINFNYSFNEDGGWDCTLKLIGLGNIIETQKINNSYRMPRNASKALDTLKSALKERLKSLEEAKWLKQNEESLNQAREQYNKAKKEFEDRNPITDIYKLYENSLQVDGKVGSYPPKLQLSGNDRSQLYLLTKTILSPETDQGYWMMLGDASGNNAVETVFPDWWGLGTKGGFPIPLEVGGVYKFDIPFLQSVLDKHPPQIFNSYLRAPNGALSIPRKPPPSFDEVKALKQQAWIAKLLASRVQDIEDLKRYKKQDPIPFSVVNYNEYSSVSFNAPVTWGWSGGLEGIQENGSADDLWVVEVSLKSIRFDPTQEEEGRLRTASAARFSVADVAQLTANALDRSTYEAVSTKGPLAKVEVRPFKGRTTYSVEGVLIFEDKQKPSQAIISVQLEVEIGTVPLIDDNQNTFSSKAFATVEIATNLTGFITDRIARPGDQQEKPTFTEPQYIPSENIDEVLDAQIVQNSGLGSALEALLTYIHYDALVNWGSSDRVIAKSVKDITKEFIQSVPDAPMRALFNLPSFQATGKEVDNKEVENEASKAQRSPSGHTDPYYLGLKGYNTALMSGQTDQASFEEYYKTIPTVDFGRLMRAYLVPKTYTSSDNVLGLASVQMPTYVPLGYLLFLLNNLCLLYDGTTPGEGGGARPFFYIDFNPATNLCFTMPSQLAINPEVCLIPYKGLQKDYKTLVESELSEGEKETFSKKEFNFVREDVVSQHLPAFIDQGSTGKYRGYTMNILVNIQHILNVIREISEADGHNEVTLKPFLERLLADINKSLGDVNAFRVGYIDASNTVAICDDQFTPALPGEDATLNENSEDLSSPDGKFIVPIFEKRSIARSLDFHTNITTKMSSMLAIGARGGDNYGATQGLDGSPLYWLSRGLKDRVIRQAEDATKTKEGAKQGATAPTGSPALAAAELFDGHVRSIYGTVGQINRAAIPTATNFFIQGTTSIKAIDPGSSGAPIIPLNLSFSTDGISGINLGNTFLIPEDRLPISLRGPYGRPRFAYMVVGLNHDITDNQWTTNVRGQIIKLRDENSYRQAGTISKAAGAIQRAVAEVYSKAFVVTSLKDVDVNNSDWLTIAVQLLKHVEGFSKEAMKDVNAYRLGYGTRYYKTAQGYKIATKESITTPQDAEEVLREQLGGDFKKLTGEESMEQSLISLLGAPTWEALAPYQKAAVVSIRYNTGPRGFPRSLINALQRRDFSLAAGLIPRVSTTSQGKEILLERRAKEAFVFRGGKAQ